MTYNSNIFSFFYYIFHYALICLQTRAMVSLSAQINPQCITTSIHLNIHISVHVCTQPRDDWSCASFRRKWKVWLNEIMYHNWTLSVLLILSMCFRMYLIIFIYTTYCSIFLKERLTLSQACSFYGIFHWILTGKVQIGKIAIFEQAISLDIYTSFVSKSVNSNLA